MQIRTGFQGSSIKFSPYEDGRIAVGTAQNFGIIGNGKQHVFQVQSALCRTKHRCIILREAVCVFLQQAAGCLLAGALRLQL